MTSRFATWPILAMGLLISQAAYGQIPGQNPDWPCAQQLIVKLEPGGYWNGPVPQHTDWRDDEKLFGLVAEIVDRDTPDADGLAKLNAYVDSIPADQRATALPRVFSAIVDQTNDERSLLIQRIEQLGHRQRNMGDEIAQLSTKADGMPESDPKRPDLVGERDFDVRAFQETQHTMRYACEAPANMERRLGIYARALQAKLNTK
jgi:hypothetical protein